MGAVRVVVLDVLGEHSFQMAAPEDEHPIEALAPEGTDHPLADGIGLRRLDWGLDDPGSFRCEHSVEAVNLVSRSRMRNLTAFTWSARFIERLRACWVTQPATGGGSRQRSGRGACRGE